MAWNGTWAQNTASNIMQNTGTAELDAAAKGLNDVMTAANNNLALAQQSTLMGLAGVNSIKNNLETQRREDAEQDYKQQKSDELTDSMNALLPGIDKSNQTALDQAIQQETDLSNTIQGQSSSVNDRLGEISKIKNSAEYKKMSPWSQQKLNQEEQSLMQQKASAPDKLKEATARREMLQNIQRDAQILDTTFDTASREMVDNESRRATGMSFDDAKSTISKYIKNMTPNVSQEYLQFLVDNPDAYASYMMNNDVPAWEKDQIKNFFANQDAVMLLRESNRLSKEQARISRGEYTMNEALEMAQKLKNSEGFMSNFTNAWLFGGKTTQDLANDLRNHSFMSQGWDPSKGSIEKFLYDREANEFGTQAIGRQATQAQVQLKQAEAAKLEAEKQRDEVWRMAVSGQLGINNTGNNSTTPNNTVSTDGAAAKQDTNAANNKGVYTEEEANNIKGLNDTKLTENFNIGAFSGWESSNAINSFLKGTPFEAFAHTMVGINNLLNPKNGKFELTENIVDKNTGKITGTKPSKQLDAFMSASRLNNINFREELEKFDKTFSSSLFEEFKPLTPQEQAKYDQYLKDVKFYENTIRPINHLRSKYGIEYIKKVDKTHLNQIRSTLESLATIQELYNGIGGSSNSAYNQAEQATKYQALVQDVLKQKLPDKMSDKEAGDIAMKSQTDRTQGNQSIDATYGVQSGFTNSLSDQAAASKNGDRTLTIAAGTINDDGKTQPLAEYDVNQIVMLSKAKLANQNSLTLLASDGKASVVKFSLGSLSKEQASVLLAAASVYGSDPTQFNYIARKIMSADFERIVIASKGGKDATGRTWTGQSNNTENARKLSTFLTELANSIPTEMPVTQGETKDSNITDRAQKFAKVGVYMLKDIDKNIERSLNSKEDQLKVIGSVTDIINGF